MKIATDKNAVMIQDGKQKDQEALVLKERIEKLIYTPNAGYTLSKAYERIKFK